MAIRLGFIGGGCNSAVGRTHFVSSQMDGRFKVCAGAFSRHRNVVEDTCRAWGIALDRGYVNAHDFLDAESGKIDAVAILTPIPHHTEYIVEAVRRGIPVICEKALCSTLEDSRLLCDLLDKTRHFLRLTFTYSGYPMVREARRRINSPAFGKLLRVQVEMPQEGFIKTGRDGKHVKPQEWRQHDYAIPTISLDLGAHVHHLIGFLTDATPESVCAVQRSRGCMPGVVDDVSCLVTYNRGFDSTLWYSKVALGNRNGLLVRVFGERESLEWRQSEPELLKMSDSQGTVRLIDRASPDSDLDLDARYGRFKVGHPSGFIEAFGNIYSDFATELLATQPSAAEGMARFYTARFADEGLRLLDAISRSSQQKQWVHL